MPILDGESAARMIKSTKNANQNTPIVAITSYELNNLPIQQQNTIFSAILQKPVNKTVILDVLKKLGFQTVGAPTKRKSEGAATPQTAPNSKPPSPTALRNALG